MMILIMRNPSHLCWSPQHVAGGRAGRWDDSRVCRNPDMGSPCLVLYTLPVCASDYVRISGQIVDCKRIDWITILLGLLMDTDCAGTAKPCLSWF